MGTPAQDSSAGERGTCPRPSRRGLFDGPLARHLTLVMVLKTALLFGLWALFFSSDDEQPLTVEQISGALVGASQDPTSTITPRATP